LGIEGWDEALWLCTTCALCEEGCPRGVPISEVILSLRNLSWRQRQEPRHLRSLLWGVYWNGNPWGRPPSQRSAWARDLDISPFSPEDEILYYVGCTASSDRRMQKIARSLVTLFREAGVRFGTLGDQEPCCGEGVASVGHRDYAQEIIDRNARLFDEAGVTTVVTTSPHCFEMFARRYPNRSGRFRPLHYTQFLSQLIEAGRLRFEQSLPMRVTYHDPCYLGRRSGVYDEPRRILEAIPGLELVEMAHNRAQALCCGGGGGRMWTETPAGERFADLRAQEAAETKAEALVTACSFCISCLDDSLKAARLPQRVLDVSEVAVMALRAQPAEAATVRAST
jgi:Fe-S oxidoreductase